MKCLPNNTGFLPHKCCVDRVVRIPRSTSWEDQVSLVWPKPMFSVKEENLNFVLQVNISYILCTICNFILTFFYYGFTLLRNLKGIIQGSLNPMSFEKERVPSRDSASFSYYNFWLWYPLRMPIHHNRWWTFKQGSTIMTFILVTALFNSHTTIMVLSCLTQLSSVATNWCQSLEFWIIRILPRPTLSLNPLRYCPSIRDQSHTITLLG